MAFASGTEVSEEKSRIEIERLLTKRGASQFGVLTNYEQRTATIGFVFKSVHIQMAAKLPDRADRRFTRTPSGRHLLTADASVKAYQGEVRRVWRALALTLKAKLVSVDEGITTFEREFMPYMVTADGRTIGEKLDPVIKYAMEGNALPAMLALPSGGGE